MENHTHERVGTESLGLLFSSLSSVSETAKLLVSIQPNPGPGPRITCSPCSARIELGQRSQHGLQPLSDTWEGKRGKGGLIAMRSYRLIT